MSSADIVSVLRKIIEHVDAEHTADSDLVVRYNIREDGEVAQTYVMRAREQKIDEEAADDFTVQITIDESDFVALFKGEAQLVELSAAGSIEVTGDEEELAKLDEGRGKLLEALKALKEAHEAAE